MTSDNRAPSPRTRKPAKRTSDVELLAVVVAGATTLVAIADALDVSKPAVSMRAKELIRQGRLASRPMREGKAGRPTHEYYLPVAE